MRFDVELGDGPLGAHVVTCTRCGEPVGRGLSEKIDGKVVMRVTIEAHMCPDGVRRP